MNGETLTKAHAEALIQALTGGQTPEPGQTLVWEDDVGWTFGGAPNYAGIGFHHNAVATVIHAVAIWTKIAYFDTNMVSALSVGDHTTNDITIGLSEDYTVVCFLDGQSAGVNKDFHLEVLEIYAETNAITGITQADPGVVTSAKHLKNNGDLVKIAGVVGMVEVNDQVFVVANRVDDTFELTDEDGNDVDTTGYGGYTSGGTIQTAIQTGLISDHRWTGGAGVEGIASGVDVALTLDNTIEVFLQNHTDATDFTVDCCDFFVHQIG